MFQGFGSAARGIGMTMFLSLAFYREEGCVSAWDEVLPAQHRRENMQKILKSRSPRS